MMKCFVCVCTFMCFLSKLCFVVFCCLEAKQTKLYVFMFYMLSTWSLNKIAIAI